MRTMPVDENNKADEIEKIQSSDEDRRARDGEKVGEKCERPEGRRKKERTGDGRKYVVRDTKSL